MATGYTRQSASQIASGQTVASAPVNNEFNQLVSAFSGTTGHDHSGGTGLGPVLTTAALSGLTGTSAALIIGNGAGAFTTATIIGTSNQITIVNGTGVSGNPTISIATGYIGQASITTLGTIATGVWNGTVITGTYGGTGVNNGANTITLGGNLLTAGALTTSGAFGVTLIATNTTSVTLPTSGTLVNSAVTTLSSLTTAGALVTVGTITSGTWNATILTGTYGGTGINNGANTITLGGNISTAGALTTSGAFGVTLTATNTTSLTLPTSGTLAVLNSPAFTGTPTAPTAVGGTSTTQIATTAFVSSAVAGVGTVTNVATGTGLTGGPITGTGTISLATIANARIMANVSGISAAPSATTITALFDSVFDNTQGDIIFRGGSVWSFLSAGTSGQVFTTLGSATNPAWQTPAAVQGSFKNLAITWASNTTANISADQVMLFNASSIPFLASTVSLTLNTGTSGANGLDTGSTAATTWYYVYVIYNGSTTSCLMSLSPTAPTMPGGYTYKARIGSLRLDGSKNIIGFTQYGRQWQYTVGNNLANLPSMISGSSGTPSTPIWTSVATGTFVSATATRITTQLWCGTSADVMCAPNNSYGASSASNTTNRPAFHWGLSSSQGVMMCTMTLETSNIYYASSTATSGMWCFGFEDNI